MNLLLSSSWADPICNFHEPTGMAATAAGAMRWRVLRAASSARVYRLLLISPGSRQMLVRGGKVLTKAVAVIFMITLWLLACAISARHVVGDAAPRVTFEGKIGGRFVAETSQRYGSMPEACVAVLRAIAGDGFDEVLYGAVSQVKIPPPIHPDFASEGAHGSIHCKTRYCVSGHLCLSFLHLADFIFDIRAVASAEGLVRFCHLRLSLKRALARISTQAGIKAMREPGLEKDFSELAYIGGVFVLFVAYLTRHLLFTCFPAVAVVSVPLEDLDRDILSYIRGIINVVAPVWRLTIGRLASSYLNKEQQCVQWSKHWVHEKYINTHDWIMHKLFPATHEAHEHHHRRPKSAPIQEIIVDAGSEQPTISWEDTWLSYRSVIPSIQKHIPAETHMTLWFPLVGGIPPTSRLARVVKMIAGNALPAFVTRLMNGVAGCIYCLGPGPGGVPTQTIISQENLDMAHSFFTTIFAFECTINIVARGLFFHENAYFREPWDFLSFVFLCMSAGGNSVKHALAGRLVLLFRCWRRHGSENTLDLLDGSTPIH